MNRKLALSNLCNRLSRRSPSKGAYLNIGVSGLAYINAKNCSAFVLVVETFYPEAYHAVKQQLENELEATTQFLIKKSTDYVVVGTKKELPKMNQNTIDRLNSKGANIQIIKLS